MNIPVSYTHLDVYKRQEEEGERNVVLILRRNCMMIIPKRCKKVHLYKHSVNDESNTCAYHITIYQVEQLEGVNLLNTGKERKGILT